MLRVTPIPILNDISSWNRQFSINEHDAHNKKVTNTVRTNMAELRFSGNDTASDDNSCAIRKIYFNYKHTHTNVHNYG